MIEIRLKRKGENKSVTYGELRIPKVGFGCRTLELRDGSNLKFKQSCRIPEGTYIMVLKMNKFGYVCPQFKYKVKGFSIRPELDFENNHYNNLPSGHIAIGSDYPDAYSITLSTEVFRALSDACREIWGHFSGETIVLNVYKVVNYTITDEDYQDELMNRTFNFLDDEDDAEAEQPPLEHDSVDG